MNRWNLILKSVVHYQRTNLAVAFGVAAATAVITGALLVGDSVRGSLRHLVLDRLGKIEDILVSDRFFREELAADVAQSPGDVSFAEPAILLPATTVESRSDSGVRRASRVFAIGCRAGFWQLDASPRGASPAHPAEGEVLLSQPLAEELGVELGDPVTVRLNDVSPIPADSTLGQKSNRLRSLPRLKVVGILTAEGLGRFSLQPNQSLPRNVYLPLASLQEILEVENRANAILAGSDPPTDDDSLLATRQADRDSRLHPNLRDFGLRVERIRREYPASVTDGESAEVIYDYFSVTTDRMIFESVLSDAVLAATKTLDAQPVLSYLADSIRRADAPKEGAAEIPYSIATGIESSPAFPLLETGGAWGPDEIILNQWAANRLAVQPNDRIVMEFFEPETAHGEHRLARREFTLRAVVPLIEPATPFRQNRPAVYSRRPAIFNDPDLTPVVKGITDQDSIEEWEAPFPFEISRMNPIDDEYWKNHRTTPKAFIPLATAQRLWGSRFGRVTSIRIPFAEGLTAASIEQDILRACVERKVSDAIGFTFRPVKREGLAAARGTTPFDGLFLGLSFFLILAAVLLVALLFRLSVEQRATQLGVLIALGFTRVQAVRVIMWEGLMVAGLGGVPGVLVGIGYSALMLAGLRSPSWWRGAIGTPFLELHIRPGSLLLGYASGVVICASAIWLSSRPLRRVAPRHLLAGQAFEQVGLNARHSRAWDLVALVVLIGAAGVAIVARGLAGEAQAGAFVGGGFLVLVGLLIWQWNRYRSPRVAGKFDLARLAASSAQRNPTRSLLTIGLVGSATFLIVAMSAFRVTPSLIGAGGFRLMARSSAPIFENLDDAATRATLLGASAESLSGSRFFSLRWKAGDDASCRNLYKVARPSVLGVPRGMADHYQAEQSVRFPWAGVGKDSRGESPTNPWDLLWESSPQDGVIPVILDQNTAMYSLHWTGGVGSEYSVSYEEGVTLRFRIVGLLANTLLQGALLISERDFERSFPNVNGYQFFLIDAPESDTGRVRELLEERLSDQGFDVEDTHSVLGNLLAVQNTYLSTFQSLGALGLLLGTFGLATVQVRSVFERRGELALLRAAGFGRSRVFNLVMLENVTLLLRGLGTGIAAAICAVLPHIIWGGASVPVVGVLRLLLVVLGLGVATGAIAVRLTLRGSLTDALKGE